MSISIGKLIGTIFRDLFMGGKCMLLTYKLIQVSYRYFKTYDTIVQFEIWFLIFSAMKVFLVAPNMCFIMNINYLFVLYAWNSTTQAISNYHLHCKLLSAIYANVHILPFKIWVTVRLFLLFCIVCWAMYPNYGLACEPYIYPVQMQTLLFMEFLTSVLDTLITACIPGKVDVIKEERRRRGSLLGDLDAKQILGGEDAQDNYETSSVLSTLSSLDGDADPTLLNPHRRKFQNDKEYLKFVRLQVWWNIGTQLFIGCYCMFILTASLLPGVPYRDITCERGFDEVGKGVIWESENLPSEAFIAMHPVLVVMSTTFDYFVYFSIPYRLNRIKKSKKEIEYEEQARQKKQQKRRKKKAKKRQVPEDEVSPAETAAQTLTGKNVDKISECSREEDSDSSSFDGENFTIQGKRKRNSILDNALVTNPDF